MLDPEAWEKATLFSNTLLGKILKAYDPDMHAGINEVWARKRIQEGDLVPVLAMTDIIGDLRRFWKLTESP